MSHVVCVTGQQGPDSCPVVVEQGKEFIIQEGAVLGRGKATVIKGIHIGPGNVRQYIAVKVMHIRASMKLILKNMLHALLLELRSMEMKGSS